MTVNGGPGHATVLEAVVLQLMQKTAAGDARARRLLLRYQEFVARAAKPRRDIVFVDSDDTPQLPTLQEGIGGGGV